MKTLLLCIIILTINACSNLQQTNNVISEREASAVPVAWKPVSGCSIDFFAPLDLEEKKPYYIVHYSGKCIKAYGNENIWLNLVPTNLPANSSEFAQQRDYQLEKIDIDGRRAELVTFRGTEMVNEAEGKEYVAIMNVPKMSETVVGLKMWAYSKSPADRENVIKIFKSVRFPEE